MERQKAYDLAREYAKNHEIKDVRNTYVMPFGVMFELADGERIVVNYSDLQKG